MAVVALGPDRFELSGFGAEHLPKLALSGGRADDWLRQRELVRPGTKQPMVDNRRSFACQRPCGECLPGNAGSKSFHWPGNGSTRPAFSLERDAGSCRGGRGKCGLVHHFAEMGHKSFLPLLHDRAYHRSSAGGAGNMASVYRI